MKQLPNWLCERAGAEQEVLPLKKCNVMLPLKKCKVMPPKIDTNESKLVEARSEADGGGAVLYKAADVKPAGVHVPGHPHALTIVTV